MSLNTPTRVLVVGALICALSGCVPSSPTPSESASPSASSAALITIDNPTEGAEVTTPLQADGTASTFEAALTVDVVDAMGATLCVRNVLATSGSGTPGEWQAELALAPLVEATTVTLRAYSHSAADGSIENLVERTVTVSTERPAIFITSPACGATFSAGDAITVDGRAFVFEAALLVELRNSSGVVAAQSVMATRGDEESPWTASLAIAADAAPGVYELVAYDLSARDGTPENEFAIQVFVQN